MATIVTTKGSAAVIEEIIRKADKKIYLLSYSFIMSDSFINRLRQAVERGVVIEIVYGKSIKESSLGQLKQMANVKILFLENLHVKLFANENKCIIGSMNFSEASEINNTELGVTLTSQNDKEAFDDAMEHCRDILNSAKLIRPMMPKAVMDEIKKNTPKQERDYAEGLGYCIRTGSRIPLNHEKPYSSKAYQDWLNNDNDDEYEEQYDHFTGEKSFGKTSRARPVLPKNWKMYQRAIAEE
jgi:phosphatidylserine/phosphatidylglycerophosphate/cardiolipin synthase-like enzyme